MDCLWTVSGLSLDCCWNERTVTTESEESKEITESTESTETTESTESTKSKESKESKKVKKVQKVQKVQKVLQVLFLPVSSHFFQFFFPVYVSIIKFLSVFVVFVSSSFSVSSRFFLFLPVSSRFPVSPSLFLKFYS